VQGTTTFPFRAVLQGVFLGLVVAGGAELLHVIAGRNTHVVVPGVLYRTAQPSAEHLERLVREHGIRTVVNLRGTCDSNAWFQAEANTTHRLGVAQEDLAFSAGRLPSARELRQLVEVIDRCELPLLFHCNRGIDRTGLAVAITFLLHSDSTVPAARRHLSLRHGHLAYGKTGYMDRFLDLYEQWLERTEQPHTRAAFRRFAEEEYRPGPCWAVFEVREPEKLRKLPVNQFTPIRIRCSNASPYPWEFTPAPNAGIHCNFAVLDLQGRNVAGGRSGLFYATVPPTASIDLTLALPPLPPGRYQLRVDLFEGEHGYFFQMGSEPLFCDMEVG
jgi:protein tyrosine phosphatase (PTP) superfamily phosphohydrolase (DUF442 family)